MTMKIILIFTLVSMMPKLFAETAQHIDLVDLQREEEMKEWKAQQNNLPDSKRSRVAHFGGYVLVEKATKLTLGVYPVENGKIVNLNPKPTKQRMRSRQLQIVFNGTTYAYDIGSTDACPDSNSEIIKNTSSYIFWIDRCFSTNSRGESENMFTHYVYDKTKNSLINFSTTTYQRRNALLNFNNGIYKYKWIGQNQYGDKRNIFYYFEISPKDGANLTCHKTWNDSCGDLNLVPLLYKK